MDDGDLSPPANTRRERSDESRVQFWLLITGNRRAVVALILLGTFLLPVGLAVVGPSSMRKFLGTDAIGTLLSSTIIAVVTAVTFVLTASQIVLSQELGTIGDVRERMDEEITVRRDLEALSVETERVFDDLLYGLQFLSPAREYVKSNYLQWEFVNLSRVMLYSAMPALALSACMLLIFDAAAVTGTTLRVENSYLAVALAFTLALFPIAVLLAYPLRILTLTRRTLAVGSFILRSTRRQSDEDQRTRQSAAVTGARPANDGTLFTGRRIPPLCDCCSFTPTARRSRPLPLPTRGERSGTTPRCPARWTTAWPRSSPSKRKTPPPSTPRSTVRRTNSGPPRTDSTLPGSRCTPVLC